MDVNERLPALRPVDITAAQGENGEPQFVLQDRSQVAQGVLQVSAAGYFLLAHLDGEHTCADIQAAFLRQFGMRLPAERVWELVQVLDETCFLHGARYEEAYAAQRAAYLAAPARDNRARYGDGAALRAELEQMLARGTAAPVQAVRGLIVPHLDYARGAPCYGDGYATLAQMPPAERYVILGANHAGRSRSVVATRKDFQTPLGLVPTDRLFLDALEGELGRTLCGEELDHQCEHSVELQVHIAQVLAGEQPFEIVPVLCSNVDVSDGGDGDVDEPRLRDFADALARLLARTDRRTVVIAGADLSHVGQQFGEAQPTTAEFMEVVARRDREVLSLVAAHEEDAMLARVDACANETRICSVACIYALLRALPGGTCRLLRYHQAVNYAAEMHVTCAAVVVE